MSEALKGSILFDEGGAIRSGAELNLVTVQSLEDPEAREGIPSLQEALEAWRFNDDHSLLWARIFALPRAHAPMEFVTAVYEDLTLNGLPFAIVSHEPAFSAGENEAILSQKQSELSATTGSGQPPHILKTVTVRFPCPEGCKTILVSGVGDFRLDRGTRKGLGAKLGLSAKNAKRAAINPRDFDVAVFAGFIPGMLKPTVQPQLAGNFDGVAYLRLSEPDDFVACTVSPIDTMVFPADHFEAHLRAYAGACYSGFELVEAEGFDFWVNRN